MREFYHVDEDASTISKISARDARRAALKVATKGFETAHIVDPQMIKLHIYYCSMRELNDSEKTEFSEKHKIVSKPAVSKAFYSRIPVQDVPPFNAWNSSNAMSITRDLLKNQ